MSINARGLAHAHLGTCEAEHTKACDMLTVEVGRLFREVNDLRELLGRWMVWASGVAFKSAEGEALVKDTDAVLAPGPLPLREGSEPETGELRSKAVCPYLIQGRACVCPGWRHEAGEAGKKKP